MKGAGGVARYLRGWMWPFWGQTPRRGAWPRWR